MSHFSFLRSTDAMADIIVSDMERFAPYLQFAQNVMRGDSELSEAQRELMVVDVSVLNACNFCFGAHRKVAESFGADPALIDALAAEDYSCLDEKLRPIFSLVKKLTIEPSKVVKSDIEAITGAGWSERTAQDVICVTAFMNCSNRIVMGHGVEGSPDAFAMAIPALGPGGAYSPDGVKQGVQKDGAE